ncbi:MAG: NAD-dependent epimerase/dehydratase family protein [Candidatus Staskawiczbacteria bacterium]|nr:NAD-dependent epimerase/dehydratase family protein [Candidatus Staskawiczbacteria bacterium]
MADNRKKIFLSGGDGFIGRNILECLNEKYNFVSPSAKELDLTNAQAVYDFLEKEKVDIVLHAANVGGIKGEKEPPDAISANLKMFFNLLRAKPFYKKMIMFGSGAEYGKTRPIVKIKEDDFDKYIPEDQYGFYKYICSKYAEKTDFITHIRLFGVFGKYEQYETRFISNAICRVLLDIPIAINQNVFFDYICAEDVAKAVDCLIEKKAKHKFYNIGSGRQIDLMAIAKKILQISGKNLEILVENSGLNNEYTCDVSRFLSEFPDFKCADFEESIKKMFDYYKPLISQINIK